MDGTGNFSHADDEGHDQGVETPLNIGNDERRMHVRAYNYWVSLLDGRAYPSIEDLEPSDLNDFAANSVLLDFTNGVDDPAITFLGEALREECDLAAGVSSIRDIPSRSLLSRLTDHYLQIIANRAPIGFEAEFVNHRANNTMYRGILMPFSSDDDTIDFIYGVINWKEVADDEMLAQLTDEVERALAANPPRPLAPQPVWADGPHRQNSDVIPALATAIAEPASEIGDDFTFAPEGNEGLSDWLAVARMSAEQARDADQRGRASLYRALGLAYDFALATRDHPHDYAELLADNAIVVQERAPMTPVVKLVFGVNYDKTRIAEYSLILGHALRIGLEQGALAALIETTQGGVKAIVTAERAARRPLRKAHAPDALQSRMRQIQPKGIVEMPGDEEFVMLFARRIDQGHVAVLGHFDHDDAMMRKAMKQVAG